MNQVNLHLPESLYRSIQLLADREGYSVEQFLTTAAAEKLAALKTLEYLRQEARSGRREDFERFLAAVPDRKPPDTDHLP